MLCYHRNMETRQDMPAQEGEEPRILLLPRAVGAFYQYYRDFETAHGAWTKKPSEEMTLEQFAFWWTNLPADDQRSAYEKWRCTPQEWMARHLETEGAPELGALIRAEYARVMTG